MSAGSAKMETRKKLPNSDLLICYLVTTRKQHYLSKHDEKLQLVLLIKTENCKIYRFVLRPMRRAVACRLLLSQFVLQ